MSGQLGNCFIDAGVVLTRDYLDARVVITREKSSLGESGSLLIAEQVGLVDEVHDGGI